MNQQKEISDYKKEKIKEIIGILSAHADINCPYCGERIKSGAKKCRYCGEWLVEKTVMEPVAPPLEITNKVNQQKIVILEKKTKSKTPDWIYYELIGIGGFMWGLTDSCILGLAVAITGIVIMQIPMLGYLLCLFLGLAWGVIIGGFAGYFIGDLTIGGILGVVSTWAIISLHLNSRKKYLANG